MNPVRERGPVVNACHTICRTRNCRLVVFQMRQRKPTIVLLPILLIWLILEKYKNIDGYNRISLAQLYLIN